MAQTYTQYPNNAVNPASDQGSASNLKEIYKNAPHRDFVGKLTGFTVFNIVMDGIFHEAWWVGLISFFIFIGVVEAFVKFIKHPERDTYFYPASEEKVRGSWISFIIVRVIMAIIFRGMWIGEIAPAVLLINAIEQTYMLIQTKKQQEKALIQPAYSPAPVNVALTSAPVYVAPTSAAKFCAICGTSREAGAQFCSGCGHRFE